MNKKLMLLALGALTALAMTALPSAASAGEFVQTCSGGGTCEGKIENTGLFTIEDDNGISVRCTSTTGTVTAPQNSSTGTLELKFHGCTEELLLTQCQSAGQPTGTIAVNQLVTHNIYIDPNKSTPGVLITGVNVTYGCASFGGVTKTVTGSIIGHIENPECAKAKTIHTVEFLKHPTMPGTQKYEQVTTAGPLFDLIVATGAAGQPEASYTTTSQAGTAHINWQAGKTVTLDC